MRIQDAPGLLIIAPTSVFCFTTTRYMYYLILICSWAKVVLLLDPKKEKEKHCLAAYGAAQACSLQHLQQTAEYGIFFKEK